MVDMPTYRSLLFVPGDRPDRFARALSAGADAVCLDLEDSVGADRKHEARSAIRDWLGTAADRPCAVGARINGLVGLDVVSDLAALRERPLDFLMVPKVENAGDLAQLALTLSGQGLWPIIETPLGLRHAWDIVAAPGVMGALFGAFDYAAAADCALEWEPLLFARSQVVAACAASGVQRLDAPCGDISDLEGLREGARRARALGFTGKACIHPGQIGGVHQAWTPSEADLDFARRALAAFEKSGGASVRLDGRMVDLPVALAARRVFSRVGK